MVDSKEGEAIPCGIATGLDVSTTTTITTTTTRSAEGSTDGNRISTFERKKKF